MGPLLLILLGTLPQRLVVAFEREPGACAMDARVPQAIGRFLPGLELGRSGEGWRLTVHGRPDEIELVLEDDAGTETLRRVIPSAPEACAATADGIGLIVERHLRDLGYEPPLPPVETATAATVETGTGTVAAPAPAPPPKPEVPTFVRGRIGVAGLFDAPDIRVGGTLDLSLDAGLFRFELFAFGLVPWPGHQDLVRSGEDIGDYRVSSAGGILSAGVCLRPGAWSICALFGGGPEWVTGRVDSDRIFGRRSSTGIAGLAAGGLELDRAVSRGFLVVRALTLVRPDPVTFRVTDVIEDTSPYTGAPWALFVSIGGGVQIF